MFKQLIREKVGSVITIKTIAGMEIMGKLVGVDDKLTTATISNPFIVVISTQNTAIVPYQYTGDLEAVPFAIDHIFSCTHTIEQSANDYEEKVKLYKQAEEEAASDIIAPPEPKIVTP